MTTPNELPVRRAHSLQQAERLAAEFEIRHERPYVVVRIQKGLWEVRPGRLQQIVSASLSE